MNEAIVTGLGLLLAVAATILTLLQDKKPGKARMILLICAILGLGAGGYTTYLQYRDRMTAEDDKTKAEKRADDFGKKLADLTALNDLGSTGYYVVIDTFTQTNKANCDDYKNVRGKLVRLFPDAESHHLLWTAGKGKDGFEFRLGKNLSLAAADLYFRLADEGSLSNGKPMLRRTMEGNPPAADVNVCNEH